MANMTDTTTTVSKQEAQLSQTDRAMVCFTEYFTESFKVTQDHSK